MAPVLRHVVRFAQTRGTFCSDIQLRWLFLSLLFVGLAFTLHASARQKSGPGALAETRGAVMTIASASTLSAAPLRATAARTDTPAARRQEEDAARPHTTRRTQRVSKRLRAYTEDQVQDLIRAYAESFGLDPELPLAIARCESQFQWDAANRGSSARGVFQYVATTWRHTDEGKRGTSALDAEANIRMALTHIATIGTSPWRASRACWSAAHGGGTIGRVTWTESASNDDEGVDPEPASDSTAASTEDRDTL
jgi:hypothetical protein